MRRQRGIHEVRPDWQSRSRTRQTKLRSVFEANPNNTHEIRCVTREPTIARGSSLAGNVELETTRANRCAGAAIHDVLHERSHDISDVRPHDFIFLCSWLGDRRAAAGRHARDRDRRRARSTRRERGIGRSHLQRRCFRCA